MTHDIPDSTWATLAARRIFFGHQSVGFNIIEGIRDLIGEAPRHALRIVQSNTPDSVEGAALIHAAIGENRRPETKNVEFAKVLAGGFGDAGGIAIFKYCYLDVTPATDVRTLFAAYRETIDSLQAKYPRLTIAQMTEPLVTAESRLESRLRLLLGKASDRALNAKRAEFNRLLVAEYGPRGTVFDLARLESTRPNGTRAGYTVGGDSAYALLPEYTDDGGHLNQRGRRVVAEQFLLFLSRLSAGTRDLQARAPSRGSTR